MYWTHGHAMQKLDCMRRIGNLTGTVWAFIALSAVWGASFLFMKVGLEGLSPTQVVLGRLSFGAATLIAIMLVTRRRWPRKGHIWAHLLVVAVFFAVVPYSLFAWAEQQVPSSLASIYNGVVRLLRRVLASLPVECRLRPDHALHRRDRPRSSDRLAPRLRRSARPHQPRLACCSLDFRTRRARHRARVYLVQPHFARLGTGTHLHSHLPITGRRRRTRCAPCRRVPPLERADRRAHRHRRHPREPGQDRHAGAT